MTFKKSVYVSGPRMGTNNSIKGIELKPKKRKKNGRKKRS